MEYQSSKRSSVKAMDQYRTKQNEMVDAICQKIFGDESGFVEAMFEANPGLAALPDPLPIGTVINIPETQVVNTQKVIALWD